MGVHQKGVDMSCVSAFRGQGKL